MFMGLWKCPSEVNGYENVHLKLMVYENVHVYEMSIWS